MNRLKLILMAVFFTGLSLLMMRFVAEKPRIFILESYYNDYTWTRDIDAGVRRVLGGAPKYATRWYYMDTKRHPWPAFKAKTGIAARKAIDAWRPDIVIAVDDDAQAYAAKYYAGHPHISVVFAGVNDDAETYGYDNVANVTGILERQRIDAVKSAVLEIAKSKGWKTPVRVALLGDTSETVEADSKNIAAYDWSPLVFTGATLVKTFGEWQQAVDRAGGTADVILTTNYRGLARGASDPTLVPPGEVVSWTETHANPFVLGTYGFFVEDGGTLAIATSPFEQGEVAARMALDIIEGAKPKDIPIERTRQFVVFMRGEALKAKGIVLPDIYEAFARATKNYY